MIKYTIYLKQGRIQDFFQRLQLLKIDRMGGGNLYIEHAFFSLSYELSF